MSEDDMPVGGEDSSDGSSSDDERAIHAMTVAQHMEYMRHWMRPAEHPSIRVGSDYQAALPPNPVTATPRPPQQWMKPKTHATIRVGAGYQATLPPATEQRGAMTHRQQGSAQRRTPEHASRVAFEETEKGKRPSDNASSTPHTSTATATSDRNRSASLPAHSCVLDNSTTSESRDRDAKIHHDKGSRSDDNPHKRWARK